MEVDSFLSPASGVAPPLFFKQNFNLWALRGGVTHCGGLGFGVKILARPGLGCTPKGAYGQHSVLRRVLRSFWGRGSQKGSEKGVCYGFYSKKGF